jgi:hypothetical protein
MNLVQKNYRKIPKMFYSHKHFYIFLCIEVRVVMLLYVKFIRSEGSQIHGKVVFLGMYVRMFPD